MTTALAPDLTWEPPHRVRLPAMRQRWSQLTFIHWPYDPKVVARHVPRDLEVDTFQGAAWVSLTPFRLEVLPPAGPAVTLVITPETNVRTYVRHRGRSGIWFFSLDVASVVTAAVARAWYGLPYLWSSMSADATGARLRYRCRRFSSDGARHDVSVRIGTSIDRNRFGELDQFLTARWRLFVKRGPVLFQAPVEHPPLEFARVTVAGLEESLVRTAGLPNPHGQPVVHHVPTVEVKVAAPRPA